MNGTTTDSVDGLAPSNANSSDDSKIFSQKSELNDDYPYQQTQQMQGLIFLITFFIFRCGLFPSLSRTSIFCIRK